MGSHRPAHKVPSIMFVIWTTGGFELGANITSTGAALEGEGLRDTLCVEGTDPYSPATPSPTRPYPTYRLHRARNQDTIDPVVNRNPVWIQNCALGPMPARS